MLERGKIFEGAGRTRTDPARQYGMGGLMAGRTYMLSTTWNAPSVAFGGEGQIFEGKSVDDVFYGFHNQHIVKRIEQLGDEPSPPGCQKLSGHDRYRIRQGQNRIVYGVEDDKLIVYVVKIGHRKDVYRAL